MPFFFETPTRREDLVPVALGNEPADMVIEGATLVNVATSETYPTDVALKGERIAAVGDVAYTKGDGTRVINASGKFLVPGLIDTHFHIESTMVPPSEFSKLVVPRGNTTVVVDPSWTANVMGVEGVKLLLSHCANALVRILIDAPSCVPLAANKLMTPGYELGVREIEEMLSWDGVVALGEMNDFKRVLNRDKEIHSEIRAAMRMRKITNGNAPGLIGRELAAYLAAGMQSDHEATKLEEGLERLRSGVRLVIRQGSSERNLKALLAAITKEHLNPRHCCFCSDDKNVLDLMEEGLVDNAVRHAILEGVNAITAIEMATLNAAEHIGIDRELGSISPGKIADILLVDDLDRFSVSIVLAGGTVVAKNGELLAQVSRENYPSWSRNTIRVARKLQPDDLKVTTKSIGTARVWVMKVVEGQITSEALKENLKVESGCIVPDTSRDILKAIVVERYGHTPPNIGKGFVTGFNLQSGAIATSVSADTHHLTAIGMNDVDMAIALNSVIDLQGGTVIIRKGRVIAQLNLPVGGFISTEGFDKVAAGLRLLNAAAKELGCNLSSPFMALSFLGNPSLPELKLSDKGLMQMSERIIPLETT